MYFDFKIMIFKRLYFEFFAIVYLEKIHGKRWAAPLRNDFILIKTIYAGSALKIRQNYASLDKFSLEMTKLSIKEF